MDVAALITDLQSRGLRVETPVERRSGGAGPSDSGLIWVEGVAATVPTGTAWAEASPYVLREEDQGYGIYRDDERLAGAMAGPRPIVTSSFQWWKPLATSSMPPILRPFGCSQDCPWA